MPAVQVVTKPKECETLILKFIKLKKLLYGVSAGKPDSILKGKIPDLKELHHHLHKQ